MYSLFRNCIEYILILLENLNIIGVGMFTTFLTVIFSLHENMKLKDSLNRFIRIVLLGIFSVFIQEMFNMRNDKIILKIILLIDLILIVIFLYEYFRIKRNKEFLEKVLFNISFVTLFGVLTRGIRYQKGINLLLIIYLAQEILLFIIYLCKAKEYRTCNTMSKLYPSREFMKSKLIEDIRNRDFAEDKSYTIAIHDNWGRGKTFFLDKVLKELNGKENPKNI